MVDDQHDDADDVTDADDDFEAAGCETAPLKACFLVWLPHHGRG